ncbi:MAG TPA: RidA family protein [Rugosimonospora sp.]
MKITAHHPAGARPPRAALSPAIRAGDLVFASGQVPVDPTSGELIGTEIAEQTTAVLDNLERVLKAAGAGLADVVKTTVFLTRTGDFAGMDAAYRQRFADRPPARSTVTIAGLARPGFLVEIEAVAVTPE